MSSPATTTDLSVGFNRPPAMAKRRLARSRRPDEGDDLGALDRQGRVVEGDRGLASHLVDLADSSQLQGWGVGGRWRVRCLVHEELPIADAGSMRSTRRSENAPPRKAARNRKTRFPAALAGRRSNGMDPGGSARSMATAIEVPMSDAMAVITNTWTNTPLNRRPEVAPTALRTP